MFVRMTRLCVHGEIILARNTTLPLTESVDWRPGSGVAPVSP